jgi:hypothetical protein
LFTNLQDIDEFLNVQKSNVVSALYDHYDMFHFMDLRYGYVYETDDEMKGKSLLETNVYRRQDTDLGEYMHPKFKEIFGCNDACESTNGKVSVFSKENILIQYIAFTLIVILMTQMQHCLHASLS